MKRYTGFGDIGVTYINGKEIKKNDILLVFKGEILDLMNSINVLMNAIVSRRSIEINIELSNVINTLNVIFNSIGYSNEDSDYRISEHKYLEELIDKYDNLLNGKEKKNLISCKVGCMVKNCYIKALKVERIYYKTNIDALYATYLNRLSTYFNVLRQYIDEENGY